MSLPVLRLSGIARVFSLGILRHRSRYGLVTGSRRVCALYLLAVIV